MDGKTDELLVLAAKQVNGRQKRIFFAAGRLQIEPSCGSLDLTIHSCGLGGLTGGA